MVAAQFLKLEFPSYSYSVGVNYFKTSPSGFIYSTSLIKQKGNVKIVPVHTLAYVGGKMCRSTHC